MGDDYPESTPLSLPEDEVEGASSADWYIPGPGMHHTLLLGAVGALLGGGLVAGSTITEIAAGKLPGVSSAHILGWIALVPLVGVLKTYWNLGRDLGHHGLQKSALGMYLILVLSQLFELASLKGIALGWEIAAWVGLSIGLLALFGVPFISSKDVAVAALSASVVDRASLEAVKRATDDHSETSTQKTRAGALGSLGLGLLALLKLLGKGLLAKLLLLRLGGRLFRQANLDWGLLVWALVVLFGSGFLIWLAIAKIRLAKKLGGFAALVGVLELAGLVVVVGLIGTALVVLMPDNPAAPPDPAQEALAAQWEQVFAGVSIAVALGWGMLTALLFLIVRKRYEPEGNFAEDLAV